MYCFYPMIYRFIVKKILGVSFHFLSFGATILSLLAIVHKLGPVSQLMSFNTSKVLHLLESFNLGLTKGKYLELFSPYRIE